MRISSLVNCVKKSWIPRRLGSALAFAGLAIALGIGGSGCSEDSDPIIPTNNAPVLSDIADIVANEGQTIQITASAIDPDGDSVTYSVSDPRFTQNNDTFTWVIGYNDAGIYSIVITADDSKGGIDSQNVQIAVNNVNSAPVLNNIANIVVNETQTVTITASGTDPEGDPLTYSISDPRFTQNNNIFTLQTDHNDAGIYNPTVTVSDSVAQDSQIVNVTVNNIICAIGWIGGASNGWKTSTGASSGSDCQSFDRPDGTFVDSNGNIYVADSINNRISKWNSSGNAQGWIGGGSNGWKTSSGISSGSDYQSFNYPRGVFVDSNGNIYVAEYWNDRISKWNSSGNAQGWIGGGSNGWKTSSGTGANSDYQSFDNPSGVFVDSSGNIYVADSDNDRISKWNTNGNAQGWIGGGQNGWQIGLGSFSGSDYQSFNVPYKISIDNFGNIYVADYYNHRISKWDNAGNAQGWIGGGSNGWKTSSGTSSGSDYQSFNIPSGVCVGSNGNIYVADAVNNRISKWNTTGTAQGWIGNAQNGWQTGSGPSWGWDYQSFDFPMGIFVLNGNIYAVDGTSNHRISKWQE